MGNDGAGIGHEEAQAMLDAFASVGATHFDVTWTTRAGEKEWFRRNVSLADLSHTLPAMLDSAPANQRNVIVRPHGPAVTFIQLDDLAPTNLARLAPAVFLILETSPRNCQAWVAMTGADNKDFARRLRKGTKADATASGATRVAGSFNFKDRYAPAFPRVTIHRANPRRLTTPAELERLDLLAPPEAPAPPCFTPARMRPGPARRKWPSYARCVDGAPLNGDKTGPDISRADFVFCMTAIDWGWSTEETAARLTEESSKAQGRDGEGYAARTAHNALVAVARRGPSP
jgi:hypothetical protein